MELIELKCKNCGAKLDIAKGCRIIICDYCGCAFYVNIDNEEIILEKEDLSLSV